MLTREENILSLSLSLIHSLSLSFSLPPLDRKVRMKKRGEGTISWMRMQLTHSASFFPCSFSCHHPFFSAFPLSLSMSSFILSLSQFCSSSCHKKRGRDLLNFEGQKMREREEEREKKGEEKKREKKEEFFSKKSWVAGNGIQCQSFITKDFEGNNLLIVDENIDYNFPGFCLQ